MAGETRHQAGVDCRQESNGTACDSVKKGGHVGETEQVVVSKMGHHREEGHCYRLEKREVDTSTRVAFVPAKCPTHSAGAVASGHGCRDDRLKGQSFGMMG